MNKKPKFTGGMDTLLGEVELNKPVAPALDPKKNGRPITQTKEITKSSQQGTKENEVRATFILNEELLEKVKAHSYWERVLFKDVINVALAEYLEKNKVKPRPEAERLKEQASNQRLIKQLNKTAKLPKF